MTKDPSSYYEYNQQPMLTVSLKQQIAELEIYKEFVTQDHRIAKEFELYKTFRILKDDISKR